MGTLFAFGQQDPNSDPDIPVSNQIPPVALWKGIQMPWGACPQQLGLSYKNPLHCNGLYLFDQFYSWKV